jgi:hypothetical protein
VNRVKVLLVLMFLSGSAHAGILDIFQSGVKDNPDRYVSVDLLATWDHSAGVTNTPALYGGLIPADSQISQQNDRGMRGQLRIPFESNVTFLIGGNYSTGDFTYSPSVNQVLLPQNGSVKGFGIEAGFRFYIHNQ